MNKKLRREAGVTLIEMMVVVTIIALFAALVLPKMMHQADRAKVTAAHADINGFTTALGAYKLDTGVFPTTEQGLQSLRDTTGRRRKLAGSVSAKRDRERSMGPCVRLSLPWRPRRRTRHHQLRPGRPAWRRRIRCRHCQLEKLGGRPARVSPSSRWWWWWR